MAKEPNPIKSEPITVALNVHTAWYLDRLIETGLYGNNRADAARIAVFDHCKMLVAQGRIDMIPKNYAGFSKNIAQD